MSLLNDYFNSKEQENIIHSEIMGPKEMFKNNTLSWIEKNAVVEYLSLHMVP